MTRPLKTAAMCWRLGVLLTAANAFAQAIVSIDEPEATATQAVIRYAAAGGAACTIQVSESPDYSPLVAEVDPGLLPNADAETARLAAPI